MTGTAPAVDRTKLGSFSETAILLLPTDVSECQRTLQLQTMYLCTWHLTISCKLKINLLFS